MFIKTAVSTFLILYLSSTVFAQNESPYAFFCGGAVNRLAMMTVKIMPEYQNKVFTGIYSIQSESLDTRGISSHKIVRDTDFKLSTPNEHNVRTLSKNEKVSYTLEYNDEGVLLLKHPKVSVAGLPCAELKFWR